MHQSLSALPAWLLPGQRFIRCFCESKRQDASLRPQPRMAGGKKRSSGDIPNSMWCSFWCSYHHAALAEPRGTLRSLVPWWNPWNPRGTLPQSRPEPPRSLSRLRPQSFQLLGKKIKKHLIRLWVKDGYPKWNPGKCKEGLKPAVPWIYFDAHPYDFALGTKHHRWAWQVAHWGQRLVAVAARGWSGVSHEDPCFKFIRDHFCRWLPAVAWPQHVAVGQNQWSFWGRCTIHFTTYFSWNWDVHSRGF